MPDSQRYRLKLYLINMAEEFVDFREVFSCFVAAAEIYKLQVT